jgi:hypothetical protein
VHARTRLIASALIAVFVLATAAVALAANPVKGAKYTGSGKLHGQTGAVSFRVSANGKRVTKLSVPTPVGCQLGGVKFPKSGSANITKHGTFTATLPLKAINGKKVGHDTVTGTFLKHRKEKGRISSHWSASTFNKCNASMSYSTKAS